MSFTLTEICKGCIHESRCPACGTVLKCTKNATGYVDTEKGFCADREINDEYKRQLLQYCMGCEDDFYNEHNDLGVKECWNLRRVKLIFRKEVHINDVPPWNHTPRLRPHCYHKKQYVYVGADQTH